MFGLGKPKQVTEREAEGEVERVYHEIKQSLRVTGVNLNFRAWAGYEKFFPVMWDAMRPTVETRAFEEAADQVRAEAARAAETLGRLDAASQVQLGESQAYQIKAALDLYHYVNPKLLVFTSAVKLALNGEYQAHGVSEAGFDGGESVEVWPCAPALISTFVVFLCKPLCQSGARSFTCGALQPFTICNRDALSADVDNPCGFQLVERARHGLPINAELFSDVLMGKPLDLFALGFAQKQRGETRDKSFEGDLLQLPLGFDHALAHRFKDAQTDLWLRQ